MNINYFNKDILYKTLEIISSTKQSKGLFSEQITLFEMKRDMFIFLHDNLRIERFKKTYFGKLKILKIRWELGKTKIENHGNVFYQANGCRSIRRLGDFSVWLSLS